MLIKDFLLLRFEDHNGKLLWATNTTMPPQNILQTLEYLKINEIECYVAVEDCEIDGPIFIKDYHVQLPGEVGTFSITAVTNVGGEL